jgi:co-chaperonin GroES (HSP10)
MLDYSKLQPTGSKILVRRYTKPEEVKGIVIPESHRADTTGTLWEFVKGTPSYDSKDRLGYADVLGTELREGDILQTRSFSGLDIGWGFFLISAEDVDVVHPWITGGEDE